MNITKKREKRSSYFYSEEEVNFITERLNSGEKAINIAKVFAVRYNRNKGSVLNKVISVKKAIKSKENSPVNKQPAAVITLPEGFTFSGNCKKVEITDNYFKVYF